MTLFNSTLFRNFSAIIIILFFTNCTTEKPKTPLFKTSIVSVESSIRKIIAFQIISFEGSEITNRNKAYTVLSVDIIDPPMSDRFPTPKHEDSVLRELGKQIVIEIQNHLKDPAEFQYYAIDFIRHSLPQETKLTRYYSYDIDNLDDLYPMVKIYQ